MRAGYHLVHVIISTDEGWYTGAWANLARCQDNDALTLHCARKRCSREICVKRLDLSGVAVREVSSSKDALKFNKMDENWNAAH